MRFRSADNRWGESTHAKFPFCLGPPQLVRPSRAWKCDLARLVARTITQKHSAWIENLFDPSALLNMDDTKELRGALRLAISTIRKMARRGRVDVRAVIEKLDKVRSEAQLAVKRKGK
jgi:hypothetical protein